MKNHAQTWSFDVLIAFFLFITVVISFIYIMSTKSSPTSTLEELVSEGKTITSVMISSNPFLLGDCTFIIGNRISKKHLEECASDYNMSKVLLGIKKDYCVHFEDSQGYLINISELTGFDGIGFGSPALNYTLFDEMGNEITIMPCRI